MPANPDAADLRERLEGFVRYRHEHLTGDEKGEAALFLENLFRALGHEGVRQAGATLEKRIKKRDNGGTAYADLAWKPRVLIEMKKGGRDLRRDYRQAFEYWVDMVPDRPEFVVLCNFDEFWIYDLNSQLEEPVDRVSLDDLPRRREALAFLLPRAEKPIFHNDLVAVTRDTAAKVSGLFNGLVAARRRTGLSAEVHLAGGDGDVLGGHRPLAEQVVHDGRPRRARRRGHGL